MTTALMAPLLAAPAAAAAPARRKQTRLTLEAVKVEGRAQRPQAFFVLPRSPIAFSPTASRPALAARVVATLHAPPL